MGLLATVLNSPDDPTQTTDISQNHTSPSASGVPRLRRFQAHITPTVRYRCPPLYSTVQRTTNANMYEPLTYSSNHKETPMGYRISSFLLPLHSPMLATETFHFFTIRPLLYYIHIPPTIILESPPPCCTMRVKYVYSTPNGPNRILSTPPTG